MQGVKQGQTFACREHKEFIFSLFLFLQAFLVAQLVKNQPAVRKT